MDSSDLPAEITDIANRYVVLTGEEVEIREIAQIPQSPDSPGMLQLQGTAAIVWLKSDRTQDQKRQTTIHELLHLRLMLEGYTGIAANMMHSQATSLAGQLPSLYEHFLIHPMETTFGYDSENREREVADSHYRQLSEVDESPEVEALGDTVHMMYCTRGAAYARAAQLCVGSEESTRLTQLFETDDFSYPRQLGEQMLSVFKKFDLSRVDEFNDAMGHVLEDIVSADSKWLSLEPSPFAR